MSSLGSVSILLDDLHHGDPAAAQALWERYFPPLVALARGKLLCNLAIADEEDVALDAFASFFRGWQRGRFSRFAGSR